MGGCATKPKATMGDDLDSAQAPAPAPLPVKDEPETVTEAKEIGDVKGVEGEVKVEGADDKAEKKGDDGEVDEQQNKPRSLGHLLDENEEKESTESGKTVETAGVQPEPQKEKQVDEQETKTEKATEASNSTAPETEEAKIPVEEKPTPTPVAAERVETEKPTEAASDNKTEKPQSSETKPVEEDVKGSTVNDAKVTEEPQKSEPRQEASALPVYSSAKVSGNEAETKQAFASLALTPFAFFLERNVTPPLSLKLLGRIFLVALCGITLGLNLYYVAISYISATYAAASTNLIPAITFFMAVVLRMEKLSMKHLYGISKVFGSLVCVSGALVFAFIKGPPIKFMNWYPSVQNDVSDSSAIKSSSKMQWVKGALIMLSANSAWSLWLILQGTIVSRYPAKVRLTALQCSFSCIQSAVVAVIFERNPSSWKLGWDVHLLSVAYCGLIVTGMTYWLQVWVIEKKGPVFTAMFTPLALLITAILSALLWKETLHWGSAGGAILLVGGLYSVLWGKKKEESTRERDEQRQEVKVEALECITHQ